MFHLVFLSNCTTKSLIIKKRPISDEYSSSVQTVLSKHCDCWELIATMTAYHSLNLNLGSKRLKNNLKCIFCSYQTWLFKYYMTSQNFPSPPAAPAFHRKMFCCYSLNYHAFPWRKPTYIRNTLTHLDSYITCIVIWCCILLMIFQRTLHVVWQWMPFTILISYRKIGAVFS